MEKSILKKNVYVYKPSHFAYSRDWHSYISVFKRHKEEKKPDFLVLAISLTKLVIWFCFKLAQ